MPHSKTGTVLTGEMFAPILREHIGRYNTAFGTGLTVLAVPNTYFGGDVSVAGLLTGQDYRDFLRARVLEPLGLARDIFVGMPDAEHARAVTIYEPGSDGSQRPLEEENTAAHKRAGIPRTRDADKRQCNAAPGRPIPFITCIVPYSRG